MRLAQVYEDMPDNRTRPFEDMFMEKTALLWAINRYLFHPRGFALTFQVGEDGQLEGWFLQGDGTETWRFLDKDDDECLARFEDFLRGQNH